MDEPTNNLPTNRLNQPTDMTDGFEGSQGSKRPISKNLTF